MLTAMAVQFEDWLEIPAQQEASQLDGGTKKPPNTEADEVERS